MKGYKAHETMTAAQQMSLELLCTITSRIDDVESLAKRTGSRVIKLERNAGIYRE